jgi:chromosome segregation ATPase
MKKFWISALEFAGIEFDKAEAEASEEINVSDENKAKIQSALDEAKGFKEKHETAAADVTRLEAELKTAQDALETAKADAKKDLDAKAEELTKANADLEAANARVAELEEAAGIDGTGAGKKKEDESEAGVPSWVDPDADHYKSLRSQGFDIGF